MLPPGHNRLGMEDKKMDDLAEGDGGLEMRFLSGAVFDVGWLPSVLSSVN